MALTQYSFAVACPNCFKTILKPVTQGDRKECICPHCGQYVGLSIVMTSRGGILFPDWEDEPFCPLLT